MGNISDSSILLLKKGLDAAWLKQKVISSNIANAETPGYKSKIVEFDELFSNIIKSAKSPQDLLKTLENAEPDIVENNATSVKENGNNVVLDTENIEMARAQLQYQYMVRALSSQISRIKYVINEGKGV